MGDRIKFEKYHEENPHVYEWFKYFAYEAVRSGHTKLSAWLVMNRVRWETSIKTRNDDGFKISNNHIAYYARLFMREHPQYGDFFRVKRMEDEV